MSFCVVPGKQEPCHLLKDTRVCPSFSFSRASNKGGNCCNKLWNDPRRVRRPGIRKYPTNAPQKDEGMIIEVSKKRRIKIRPRGTGLATVAD